MQSTQNQIFMMNQHRNGEYMNLCTWGLSQIHSRCDALPFVLERKFFFSLFKYSVRQVFCTWTKLHKMFTITCFLSFMIQMPSNPLWISRNLSLISVSKWYLSYFSLPTSLIPHQINLKKQRQSGLVGETSQNLSLCSGFLLSHNKANALAL